jgi:cell division protein FtsI (penicillin-binding protein 3)
VNAHFKRRRTRIGVLAFGMAAFFVIAALRMVALVVLDGPRLDSLARSEHMSEVELAGVRGPIVDRNGEPLAMSAETLSIYAHPQPLLKSSTAAERRRLARTLGLKPAELAARLSHHAPFVWLARHLPPAQGRAVEELGLDGVGAVSEYKRFYPESNLAASVVGMAGMDGQGLSGVELQYNRLIRGQPVELRFYHDALGRPILDSPLSLRNPEPGARLELTIDSEIQSVAQADLGAEVEKSGARGGSAIVLDPFTGEVLALANVRAGSMADHRDRLHDIAIQDAFEPGSTMKGLLASIALQDHVIDMGREIYCENGAFRIDRNTIHDDARHGWLRLGGIIEVSSNIGAAKIALALGADRFYHGLTAFGVGSRTGIDLPGEASGILRAPSTWRKIDLAEHGFGQGVAVTPMQLAVAYAAIANGGLLVQPYVLKAAYDAQGHPILVRRPQVLRRVISPEVAHTVNVLLQGVVNGPDGTGRLARVADFTVAGKTGTAQMVNPVTKSYYQGRLVSSFVGFLPANDPRLVILVVLYDVSHGDFGGLVAAPVFSKIASGAVRYLNITSETAPSAPPYESASLIPVSYGESASAADSAEPRAALKPVSTGRGVVPDFSGLSLRRALALARAGGLDARVKGEGYVVSQRPRAGAALADTAVKLMLAPVAAQGSLDGRPGTHAHSVIARSSTSRRAHHRPHPWTHRRRAR